MPDNSIFSRKVVKRYIYRDADGKPLIRVNRTEPKGFYQETFHNGLWKAGLKKWGAKLVPYRLPEIVSRQNEPIFLLEGEKDADVLHEAGFLATTSPMGAGKWDTSFNLYFQNRIVYLLPDVDLPGEDHIHLVGRHLQDTVCELRVIRLPFGKDLSSWWSVAGSPEAFRDLVSNAGIFKPRTEEAPRGRIRKATTPRTNTRDFTDVFARARDLSMVDEVARHIDLEQRGGEWWAVCPFHTDSVPSLKVDLNRWYCFGCKEGGDVIDFVAKFLNLPPLQAAKWLISGEGADDRYKKEMLERQHQWRRISNLWKSFKSCDDENLKTDIRARLRLELNAMCVLLHRHLRPRRDARLDPLWKGADKATQVALSSMRQQRNLLWRMSGLVWKDK